MMLGIESSRVIGLRLTRLMLGGRTAQHEVNIMITGKFEAAMEASGRLLVGASTVEVIQMYRRRVAANDRRLSGPVEAEKSRNPKRR